MESGLISIGKMAKMSQLSVAALRLYDELGLLKPKYKDPETGYRYYTVTDTRRFNLCRELRAAELSLEECRELIGSGDRKKIMRMVHTLYRHKADQSASGRKIHLCDENFLHDAEKLLIGEISIVLHLEPEQARDYIHKKLKEDA